MSRSMNVGRLAGWCAQQCCVSAAIVNGVPSGSVRPLLLHRNGHRSAYGGPVGEGGFARESSKSTIPNEKTSAGRL